MTDQERVAYNQRSSSSLGQARPPPIPFHAQHTRTGLQTHTHTHASHLTPHPTPASHPVASSVASTPTSRRLTSATPFTRLARSRACGWCRPRRARSSHSRRARRPRRRPRTSSTH
eukprot:182647-Chlamydomonas_euryale.AAC.1